MLHTLLVSSWHTCIPFVAVLNKNTMATSQLLAHDRPSLHAARNGCNAHVACVCTDTRQREYVRTYVLVCVRVGVRHATVACAMPHMSERRQHSPDAHGSKWVYMGVHVCMNVLCESRITQVCEIFVEVENRENKHWTVMPKSTAKCRCALLLPQQWLNYVCARTHTHANMTNIQAILC